MITVQIQQDDDCHDIELPKYQSAGAAGMDIRAAVKEPTVLESGQTKLIPAGFKMAIPEGYEAQVRTRSGLALKYGVVVLNSPGTIDSDYRGPVCTILKNCGDKPFIVNRGDRIAQMVINQVEKADVEVVSSLDETVRGEGGFNSTGVK